MESKPSEVPQDEKKQKTDAEPVLLTIDSCKQNLELTRKAALLSLLRFEQAWNPQGTNQSHLYEDLRDACVETNKQRVKKADDAYQTAVMPYQCKTEDRMEAAANLYLTEFRFKYTGRGFGSRSAKTGVIPCLNGFTAEVRLIEPHSDQKSNWDGIVTAIVTDQLPIEGS